MDAARAVWWARAFVVRGALFRTMVLAFTQARELLAEGDR